MTKRDMTEEQIMADILNRLIDSGIWGTGHQNVDQLRSWLHGKLKKNGKRVTKAINELYKKGLIGAKNNGGSIYANPRKRNEIKGFIEKHYIADWNKYLKEKKDKKEQ